MNATLFLNPWFLQQGFPLITLTNDQPTGQVTFTQQPFNNYSSLPSSPTYNYSWPVPFFWANSVTSYLKPTKKMTWLPPAYESCPNQEMPLTKASDDTPLENVHWELGNAGLSSHVRVEYDDVGFERMFNRLKLRRDQDFSIADQIMLIGDQIALLNITRFMMLPFAVRYETGTSGQDAFKIFKRFLAECGQSTTGVDNCTTIHPDIRKAVYCAGAKYGDQQAFNTLRNLYDGQVKYDFYFYTEYYAMLEGMSCSNRRNDIFDASVLASDNLDEYIDALTSTWYSQARLDQFDELTRSLQLTTDQQKIFEKYRNRTVEQILWWKNYFPIVSRAFYDDFVIGPFDMENWQKRLLHNFEPISYNLTVRPHFPGAAQYPWYQNFTFNGHVDITFKVLKSGAKLVLNSHRMVIEAANMILKRSDADKTYKISSIRKDLVNAFLYIDTDAPFTANSVWILSIDYVGFIFAKPSKGVYTNTNYFEFNDKKAWIFSTYFESGPSARSLVPCFDEPNYKARWQVTLDHPADMIALGNMPDEGFKVSKDGWSTTYFPLTPPMSSYLLAVAVGHFASLETVSETGVLVRAWAWTGMEVYAEHALKAVVGEVDFMATHFDFPFPLPKLDVLALPQYTTMKGAEEHWGLIHVAYRRELLDPLYATAATYADVANVCAHETVHQLRKSEKEAPNSEDYSRLGNSLSIHFLQWFGDLVTTVFWPRIFLNEAFANYWETNGVERAFPEQAKYNKFERYHKGLLGFAADSKIGTSKPVIPDAPKYFTAIPYNKGASLLNMLSNTITPRVLKLGLRNYLHKYQYKNVNDTQLWSELTKVADDEHLPSWDDQPLNVATLMDPWMYQVSFHVTSLNDVPKNM
ncbi:unnamed protein product [Anisakis simplex]|uniref:Aminopeptidase n=1 Tax=Anisakis simplex TaxID=6269 RepID=A0A3P6SUT5_ANISI|nr:unnamed protein product [Anisakis simplex]